MFSFCSTVLSKTPYFKPGNSNLIQGQSETGKPGSNRMKFSRVSILKREVNLYLSYSGPVDSWPRFRWKHQNLGIHEGINEFSFERRDDFCTGFLCSLKS